MHGKNLQCDWIPLMFFFYHNIPIYSIYLEGVKLEEQLTNEQLEYLRQCEYIYSILILVNILSSNTRLYNE